MPQDVLVVDDVKSYLDNVGAEIKLNMKIEPFLADSVSSALDILKTYPVKVLVTDYMLGAATGIDLVKRMRNELGLQIPCVLVSGYSDKVGFEEAMNIGFFKFINKNTAHHELVEVIRQAIWKYDSDEATKNGFETNISVKQISHRVAFNHKATSRISRITSVDSFVRDTDWGGQYVARRGTTEEYKSTIIKEVSSSYEYLTESELASSLGLDLPSIIPLLKTHLESKIKSSERVKFENKLTLNASYSIKINDISKEPASKEGAILQSRNYEIAPVYIRINCIQETTCTFCKSPHSIPLTIYLPTAKFALRQTEFYDKGQSKTIYTGFINADVPS